jgi:hypothetical protein
VCRRGRDENRRGKYSDLNYVYTETNKENYLERDVGKTDVHLVTRMHAKMILQA